MKRFSLYTKHKIASIPAKTAREKQSSQNTKDPGGSANPLKRRPRYFILPDSETPTFGHEQRRNSRHKTDREAKIYRQCRRYRHPCQLLYGSYSSKIFCCPEFFVAPKNCLAILKIVKRISLTRTSTSKYFFWK